MRRRWLWPASTAGMSAVAAVLFVLLVIRAEPRVVERIVYLPAQSTKSQGANRGSDPGEIEPPDRSLASEGGVAGMDSHRDLAGGLTGFAAPGRRPEYLRLRDQVLAFGVDTWQKPIASGHAQPGPASYREALDSLLQSEPSDEQRGPSNSAESLQGGAQL